MKFLTIFLVMMHVALAAKKESGVYYRVLHSAPSEIMLALFSSHVFKEDKMTTAGQSRLQKYFKIKRKVIRNNQVALDLVPRNFESIPYLPTRDFVRVIIERKTSNTENNEFQAIIEVSENLSVNTEIELKPHISGSLMSIKILDKKLSPKLTELAIFTLKQLNFIHETPEEAELHNQ